MSSAVPIHPLMRFARQRIGGQAISVPFGVRSRCLTTSDAVRFAARNKPTTSAASPASSTSRSSSPSQPSAAAASSPSSSAQGTSTSSSALDASAAVRAYAASTRNKPSSPPPTAAFKIADRRAERAKEIQKDEVEKGKPADPNASEDAPEGGAQKMLGTGPGQATSSPTGPSQRSRNSVPSAVQGEQDATGVEDGKDRKESGGADVPEGVVISAPNPSQGAHQYSSSFSSSQRQSTSDDDGGGGEGGPPATTEQAPDMGNSNPRQLVLYPFNTHAFIKRLQEAGFLANRFDSSDKSVKKASSEETSLSMSKRHDPAEAIMEAIHQMLVTRGQDVLDTHMNKTAVENQAYLFTAALAELRTELQVRARNDAAALRSMVTLLQREVDSLNQRMREDTASMKHDIQVDMNNRKSEAKEEQNTLEQEIQDLNNRFTISISDLKTEIEQSIKWDATRRALTIFFGCIVILIATLAAADYLTRDDVPGGATHSKAVQQDKEQPEVNTKSAEELGLVANYDEDHASRYV